MRLPAPQQRAQRINSGGHVCCALHNLRGSHYRNDCLRKMPCNVLRQRLPMSRWLRCAGHDDKQLLRFLRRGNEQIAFGKRLRG